MNKKILLLGTMFLCFASIVHASSINGDYKGNPIVKVNVNGKEIQSEVPAQIIDGNTLLPLRTISEALKTEVKWNGDTYSVDLNKKDNFISADEFKKINADVQAYRLFLTLTDQMELAQICINLVGNSTTQANMSAAQAQVDRINTTYIDGTISLLKLLNVYEYDQFVTASDYLKQVKASLKKYDTNNANTQWMIAKTSLNNIYKTLDSRLFAEIGDINIRIINVNK